MCQPLTQNVRFASLASQLTITLIWDLGLQMPTPELSAKFPPDFHVASNPQQSARKERTIEEQRVVLGAFFGSKHLSNTSWLLTQDTGHRTALSQPMGFAGHRISTTT